MKPIWVLLTLLPLWSATASAAPGDEEFYDQVANGGVLATVSDMKCGTHLTRPVADALFDKLHVLLKDVPQSMVDAKIRQWNDMASIMPAKDFCQFAANQLAVYLK